MRGGLTCLACVATVVALGVVFLHPSASFAPPLTAASLPTAAVRDALLQLVSAVESLVAALTPPNVRAMRHIAGIFHGVTVCALAKLDVATVLHRHPAGPMNVTQVVAALGRPGDLDFARRCGPCGYVFLVAGWACSKQAGSRSVRRLYCMHACAVVQAEPSAPRVCWDRGV
jgi:hypothetical protein